MASRADGMEALAASAVIDADRKAFTEAAAALREEAGRVRAGRENLARLAEAEGVVPPGLNDRIAQDGRVMDEHVALAEVGQGLCRARGRAACLPDAVSGLPVRQLTLRSGASFEQ